MQNIIIRAQNMAKDLIKKSFTKPKDIPNVSGVYLIYYRKSIIYVGISDNLFKRINRQHLGNGKSTFKNKISRKFQKKSIKWINNWIIKNCMFKYIAEPNKDMCHLVEALLIIKLRLQNQPLLNS